MLRRGARSARSAACKALILRTWPHQKPARDIEAYLHFTNFTKSMAANVLYFIFNRIITNNFAVDYSPPKR